MKKVVILYFVISGFVISGLTFSISTKAFNIDDLARRASWQAKFKPVSGSQSNVGRLVSTIQPESPLAKAGVKLGDIILNVNGRLITDTTSWYDITDALVANKVYQIGFRRQQIFTQISVKFQPVVRENYSGIKTYYHQITNDYGIRQRLIITRPVTSQKKLPAVFVVQGLSCSSIEHTPGRSSNFIRVLQDLIKQSEMVVMRVEKPGLGDSEGNCSQTDFLTELNGYETALKRLKSLDYVDSSRVIVYGSSMGSAIAPYLANQYQLNGVISDGTFYRSWFEHMLEIERRIKTMNGLTQSEVNQQINQAYIPLYYGMLIEKKSYHQLIQNNPLLAKFNYHGKQHMYGRPMSYYHQLQDFDFAGNWQKLKVPVRVRWGTNDWIMSEFDNDMIARVLKDSKHSDFKVYKYPNLDHWYTIHPTVLNSYQGKPGKWENKISEQIVQWAKTMNKKANQPN